MGQSVGFDTSWLRVREGDPGDLAQLFPSRFTGSVDLLLHLLSNIIHLPVTKTVVKTSGMGKAIGQIEKHPKCVGTANESAISERVQQVKDAWNASVKQRKSQDVPPPAPTSPAAAAPAVVAVSNVNKRAAEKDAPSPAASAKKVKTVPSSFSTLLKKVSGSNASAVNKSSSVEASSPSKAARAKKSLKRVKWADHFGGDLSASQLIEGDSNAVKASGADASVSWSDRKKRDRMREKELLSKVKYVNTERVSFVDSFRTFQFSHPVGFDSSTVGNPS
jgi:TFIIS helical bundle-like domain